MGRILRPKQLEAYLSLSKTTIWRMQKEEDFPKKVRLSQRAVGWLESDILLWLEKKSSTQVK